MAPEEIEALVTKRGTVVPAATIKVPAAAKLLPFPSFKPVKVVAWIAVKPANEPVTEADPLTTAAIGFEGILAIID